MYARNMVFPKNNSFFLFGPRGTGKSTWVKSRFENAIYLDLLDAEIYNDLLAQPHKLEGFFKHKQFDWIIIDEIQKIPLLLDEVHRLIENKGYKFILTGSSARKLRGKGVNLLGGRAYNCFMNPLTISELGEDFSFDHSLKYGLLPSVYVMENSSLYLESYIKNYITQEVQQEGMTRNLARFSRFLEAASFSQGNILNITNVASDCATERKVVENYFDILKDLLIAHLLPVFTRRANRRLVSHPKFYFFDVGVYRAIRPRGPMDSVEEIEGAALETLFLQIILALNQNLRLGWKVFYWRDTVGHEVDFVLYGEMGIIAIEIKRTDKLRNSDLSSLKLFIKDYPDSRAYLFYGGKYRRVERDIEIIPHAEALQNLDSLLK